MHRALGFDLPADFCQDMDNAYTLPASCYTSEAVFQHEKEHIFSRAWLCLCHVSELAEPQAYVTRKIVGENLVAVRGRDGVLRAFYNVCPHRGHELFKGSGIARPMVSCPYHAWTFRLDGELAVARNCENVAHFHKSDYNLVPIQVAEYAGFVFVNMDQNAPPVERALEGLEAHLKSMCPNVAQLQVDVGKPIADTTQIDLPSTVYCLEWFAEAIDKQTGEVIPGDGSFLGTVTREPVGVVAAIVPWNYPLLMAMWKLAPALATGNSVLLKPSERSPLTALRIAALARQAGLPDGVLNVLPGDGRVGQLLARHPDVDCIAFTGSGAVGRAILHAAADSNLKRVWNELGGKSPNIVFDDVADLHHAARAAAGAIFYNLGQVCSAGSRVLVQRSILPNFREALLAACADCVPAHPLHPETRFGALVDRTHCDNVERHIARGRGEARLLMGGDRLAHDGGCYLQPAVFECASGAEQIAREEIFGPVLVIVPFDDDDAIRLANDSDYGLAAAVWSQSISRIHDVSRRLRAGTVWVNCYDELADMNFPFGGYKQSGNGRDNSLHALDKYVELKSTIVRVRVR